MLVINPYSQSPPRYTRAWLYRYEFAPPGKPGRRVEETNSLGPLARRALGRRPRLRSILVSYGWFTNER